MFSVTYCHESLGPTVTSVLCDMYKRPEGPFNHVCESSDASSLYTRLDTFRRNKKQKDSPLKGEEVCHFKYNKKQTFNWSIHLKDIQRK